MQYFKFLSIIVFVVAVPVFLVTTNLRVTINLPVFYEYEFDRHSISDRTGIERNELLLAAKQVRDYFNNDTEFIDVRIVLHSIRRSIYNDREILHMRDVKSIVRKAYRLQEVTGLYIVVFTALGLVFCRKQFVSLFTRCLSLGGQLTLLSAILIGLASLWGFDRLFLAFHLLSFSNDLWQLDPTRDYLIAMFPQEFFFDATLFTAASTVTQSILLALTAPIMAWRRRSKIRS